MDRIDDDRVRETGRQLARHDHQRGRNRPISRFWAPAYREGYEQQRRELETDHRQPAGVDPAALEMRPELPEAADILVSEAQAIGCRAAHKILTRDRWSHERLAEVIEAEVRSAWGTPREGDVCVRLAYAEAVQTVTAIVEAQTDDRAASELDTLAEVRRKFLLAIGLL